nr:MAG TPA: hypothetical protein [Caudoviricetes sp.]
MKRKADSAVQSLTSLFSKEGKLLHDTHKSMCRLTIEGRLLSLSQVVKTLCGLSLVLVSIIMALPVRPLTLTVRNWE